MLNVISKQNSNDFMTESNNRVFLNIDNFKLKLLLNLRRYIWEC